MTCRLPSVETYSMRSAVERCRPWIPTSPSKVRPPIFTSSTFVEGVFFSSSAYFVLTTNLSPVNFWGQWQCSQVSRAGRRLSTGEGMGLL